MARIPEQAKCVFDGVIFSVWQWPQEQYDGTVKTFEMIKRPYTVIVIALQGEDVLFSREEQPNKPAFYACFGGRMDEGEVPLEAAKRELLEESGLESDDWELLLENEFGSKLDWIVYTYVARNCKKVAGQNLDSGERVDIQQLPLDRFLTEIVPHPEFEEREIYHQIFNKLDNVALEKFKQKILGRE
ncbi:MAG: NUDIX domain-containing protein [Alphaproteobacteria bacterium]|nr:NUDIX domain-containing protein [Alphaproteobacteria bacterium]MDD9920270.1 NUDIX domain-containing protein [Alphaproteobacteria bacterium]